MFSQVQKDLKKLANPQKAKLFGRYFKTGKGEYGEGDKFLGIMTGPVQELARKYKDLSFSDLQKLLNGVYHEERSLGVQILVRRFKGLDKVYQGREREKIFDFYLKNSKRINNWDLVDISAPHIVGESMIQAVGQSDDRAVRDSGDQNFRESERQKDRREILYKLAGSENLWERRIAIMATFAFIRENDFTDTLKISEILLSDKQDLIHKACGWGLREIGKRDLETEEKFLNKHLKNMPRTMLRYAIEKFPEEKRLRYLRG
jgi:3-methyladenine DNA glycosylase AlkD